MVNEATNRRADIQRLRHENPEQPAGPTLGHLHASEALARILISREPANHEISAGLVADA